MSNPSITIKANDEIKEYELEAIHTRTSSAAGSARGVYLAYVTPETDLVNITITHGLGTTDILHFAIWAESFGDYVPMTDGVTSRTWLKTSIPVRVTDDINRENLEQISTYNISSGNIKSTSMVSSNSYISFPVDENHFRIRAGNSTSAVFYGGVTYRVIIIGANAEV